MLKWLMLCGCVLLLSFSAAAQDFSGSPDDSVSVASAAAGPAAQPALPAVSFHPLDRSAWELAMGYQFQRYNVFGFKFNDNGFHTDVLRNFNDWLGLEATVAMGFGGNTGAPLNLTAKSLFAGGGLHITATGNRVVHPYFHALFGNEHFRFTQYGSLTGTPAGTVIGSNNAFAFMGGGGFDFKITPMVTFRVQADYIGTHFASKLQNNISVGPTLVFNF